MTHPVTVGALADAEYVTNRYSHTATLRGIVVSVAEPHTRFNATPDRVVSVMRPDGSEGTSNSTMPVHVIAPAGSPDARAAVAQLLASGARMGERARAALGALA